MDIKEQEILNLFPDNYRHALKSISLVQLKTKYNIGGVKIQKAFNVIINIFPSAYYPTGKSTVLCKLCDNMLFDPDKAKYAYISDTKQASSFIANCIKASYCSSSFGCCSKYNECSNAKICLHENPFYSLGCIYRSHLENGEIFYGVNRNV